MVTGFTKKKDASRKIDAQALDTCQYMNAGWIGTNVPHFILKEKA